jgi:hypothetical protein
VQTAWQPLDVNVPAGQAVLRTLTSVSHTLTLHPTHTPRRHTHRYSRYCSYCRMCPPHTYNYSHHHPPLPVRRLRPCRYVSHGPCVSLVNGPQCVVWVGGQHHRWREEAVRGRHCVPVKGAHSTNTMTTAASPAESTSGRRMLERLLRASLAVGLTVGHGDNKSSAGAVSPSHCETMMACS